MNDALREHIDKMFKAKSGSIAYIYNGLNLKSYSSLYKYFHNKNIPELSNEDIIEAQKYIIKTQNFKSLNTLFPNILYLSILLSKNNDIIVDDEIFKYYKDFILIYGYGEFMFRLSKGNYIYNLINNGNLMFDSSNNYGKALNYYYSKHEYDIDYYMKLAEILDEIFISDLKENNTQELSMFYSSLKGFIINIDSGNEIKNKLIDVLIDKWKEFGVFYFKSKV
jgi:hypothetical protein